MSSVAANQLIFIHPEELRFQLELEKQSFCDLKVANKTESYVAFKVKTTSPKKYLVRPNSGVIQPWDSCVIRVTLQAQKEYPPDIQCRDKFLIQSTIVPPHTDVDELPQDTFTKDSGKEMEECKLKVVYISPGSSDDSLNQSFDFNSNPTVKRLKDERDEAVRQTQQLQRELEMLKEQRNNKSVSGFSLKFAFILGLIGIIVGLVLKLSLSSTLGE